MADKPIWIPHVPCAATIFCPRCKHGIFDIRLTAANVKRGFLCARCGQMFRVLAPLTDEITKLKAAKRAARKA